MSTQIPPNARRQDAEMAIALLREELNRALAYKARYDAEGHNLCLAIIDLVTGGSVVLAAYSNNSAIPESLRLHLGLVPDTYALMEPAGRFGCNGMAQLHTEPKLLNFLTAAPAIRDQLFAIPAAGKSPRTDIESFRNAIVAAQRQRASTAARLLPTIDTVQAITLISEIDCCPTCVAYSLQRFRAQFPNKPLHTIELKKKVNKNARQLTQYVSVKVTRTP